MGPGDLAGEREALVRKRDRVLENFEAPNVTGTVLPVAGGLAAGCLLR